HHEVAPCQHEISFPFANLLNAADNLMLFKYITQNVAQNFGKTATFMPKPISGDNGSGMHCHISLAKAGNNIFAGSGYGHLSDEALFFIGGINKHARALNAFTNPTTNSYKRLVPGYEAPVLLAYSARNRSAAIRIPHVMHDQARRIEVRFPDPAANPYLAYSAMLLAGIDGIQNKIHPGAAMDIDLYEASPEELANCQSVSGSLEEALIALKQDQGFLLAGDVFTQDLIDSYIDLKLHELDRVRTIVHPAEYDLYYSV
ncbi:MAG: glutamine synthetase, partial [Pseudomonadota bacterium]|nr:glutamine synthetase [Pseudomonadota bacterium]